jgi:hypothetical protein
MLAVMSLQRDCRSDYPGHCALYGMHSYFNFMGQIILNLWAKSSILDIFKKNNKCEIK